MFHLVILSEIYPHWCTLTRFKPLPKSRDAANVENCRPIVFLFTLAKLLESFLHRALSPQIKINVLDPIALSTQSFDFGGIVSEHLDRGVQVDTLYVLESVYKNAHCLFYAADLKLVFGVERRADWESW